MAFRSSQRDVLSWSWSLPHHQQIVIKVPDLCDWPRVRIPEACRNVDVIVGIDEAGRGPVLGSLIYCAAFWPLSENETISSLGFDDSKALKEGERERLLEGIIKHPSIGWVIEEISASDISEQMLKASPVSLNAISYSGVIRMLETIRDAAPNPPCVEHVFVDTVGDPDFYKAKLLSAMGDGFSSGGFTVEKKADATYRVVSAASIIAKVTRDLLLNKWTFKGTQGTLDKDFGSGYPSDERCVKWLERNQHAVFGYPSEVMRFSWSTCREVLERMHAAKVDWPCDEEERAGADISSFFSGGTPKRKKRPEYFVKRKMTHITTAELFDI